MTGSSKKDTDLFIISREQLQEIRDGCYHEIFNVLDEVERHPFTEELVWMTPEEEEKRIRQDERKKVYDELGVLHGEAARVFNEYLNDPEIHSTPESRELIRKARELAKKRTGCPYWNPERNYDPNDPGNHCSCTFSNIRQAAINGVLDDFQEYFENDPPIDNGAHTFRRIMNKIAEHRQQQQEEEGGGQR